MNLWYESGLGSGFRAQMQTIISKACVELDIRPIPSQRVGHPLHVPLFVCRFDPKIPSSCKFIVAKTRRAIPPLNLFLAGFGFSAVLWCSGWRSGSRASTLCTHASSPGPPPSCSWTPPPPKTCRTPSGETSGLSSSSLCLV